MFLLSCSASAQEGTDGCICALLGVIATLGKQRKRQLPGKRGLPEGVVLGGRCSASGPDCLTLKETFQEDLGLLCGGHHFSVHLIPNESRLAVPWADYLALLLPEHPLWHGISVAPARPICPSWDLHGPCIVRPVPPASDPAQCPCLESGLSLRMKNGTPSCAGAQRCLQGAGPHQ